MSVECQAGMVAQMVGPVRAPTAEDYAYQPQERLLQSNLGSGLAM